MSINLYSYLIGIIIWCMYIYIYIFIGRHQIFPIFWLASAEQNVELKLNQSAHNNYIGATYIYICIYNIYIYFFAPNKTSLLLLFIIIYNITHTHLPTHTHPHTPHTFYMNECKAIVLVIEQTEFGMSNELPSRDLMFCS